MLQWGRVGSKGKFHSQVQVNSPPDSQLEQKQISVLPISQVKGWADSPDLGDAVRGWWVPVTHQTQSILVSITLKWPSDPIQIERRAGNWDPSPSHNCWKRSKPGKVWFISSNRFALCPLLDTQSRWLWRLPRVRLLSEISLSFLLIVFVCVRVIRRKESPFYWGSIYK